MVTTPKWMTGLAATLLILSAVWARPARADDLDCSKCHKQQVAASSVHSDLGCTDCHTGVTAVPHKDTTTGNAVCAQCHNEGDQLAKSVHARHASCIDCHGNPHEIRKVKDPLSAVAPVKQIQTCGKCHDGGNQNVVAGYIGSVHGRGLLIDGLDVAPTCSTCHGTHDIRPPADPQSNVSWNNVPKTCGHCHQGILSTWQNQSAHGAQWLKGNHHAPVCITCHTSHDIAEPTARGPRLHSVQVCGQCHGGRFKTYRDSFHGNATQLGFQTAAVCSDCHTPHANLPASDPRSTVNPANLQTTCSKCHKDVTKTGFVTFDPHAEPSGHHGRPIVHFIWLAMTILLLSVAGAFGLHDLLWLQRSLVAVLRREHHHEEHATLHEKWVKRFPRVHRWTHITIIITFLVLAATGLPLKFHYTAWAQVLTRIPGAIDFTRFLHRLAAVVTFGYAFVHVFYLIRRAAKREGGLLWGWGSMVPQPRDVVDLLRNIRYFLYLGPRPRFDRFTYWEKFDYFAVFWGIPVIGLSGLMLWFPAVVTHFLPGWTLNAAFVVHSDEALLATGFIFVFHFFHTHLRPESFPLDPVIFAGSMPLSKFKEERPDEYDRLVESGELEKKLVDPPRPERLRWIYLFGFTALIIGVLLAVGIFIGITHG